MNDSKEIIETIKELLKAKGITYKTLAIELDISEASVKRIFSNKTFTLERLGEICQILGSSMFEVIAIAHKSHSLDSYEYSFVQENFFANNPKYLAYFDLIVNGKTSKSIQKKYALSDKNNFRYLKKLDQLGLIELHENNKIRLLCSKNIKWRKDGPLRRLFFNKAKFEFLNSDFKEQQDYLKLSITKLSDESCKKLEFELTELFQKFERTSLLESKLKIKTKPVGILMASRKWNFSLLESITP